MSPLTNRMRANLPRTRILLIVVCLGLLVGIGGWFVTTATPATPDSTPTPAANAATRSPFATTLSPGDPARGATLYATNCAKCHGAQGLGGYGPALAKLPPEMRAMTEPERVRTLATIVYGGVAGWMPGFSRQQVSEQGLADLADYLAAIQLPDSARTFVEAAAPLAADKAAPAARYFGETRHSVADVFRNYWESKGGLERFGLPMTEQFTDISSDSKSYTVQLFERVLMEYHPDANPDARIQLALLGSREYSRRTDYLRSLPTPGLPPTG